MRFGTNVVLPAESAVMRNKGPDPLPSETKMNWAVSPITLILQPFFMLAPWKNQILQETLPFVEAVAIKDFLL